MEILRCGRIGSTTRKPTKAEKAELAALAATNDAAQAALNAYYDEDGEPDQERGERLEAQATVATFAVDQYAERFEAFDPEEMKQAGATHAVSAGAARAPKERPLHGEKLCKRLTAHRTAAVQIELAQQPTVALAVLMQRMISAVFDDVYGRAYLDYAVRIDVHTTREALVSNADDMGESVAWKALEGEREKWSRMLPRRAADLLPWLLEQGEDVLSNLFAFCVAATVDGISGADRPHAVNEISNTLAVDLSRYWKPTRAGYFEHVAKDRIAAVVGDSVSAQAAGEVRGMKKDAAAQAAELRLTDSGWLPEVLRNREVPGRVTYGYHEDDEGGDDENGDAAAEAD